jgi:DNA-binding transcriptional regulator GbsR (MarR family)
MRKMFDKLETGKISSTDAVIYTYMAFVAIEGWLWITIDELAEVINASTKTVRRSIRRLSDENLIEAHLRRGNKSPKFKVKAFNPHLRRFDVPIDNVEKETIEHQQKECQKSKEGYATETDLSMEQIRRNAIKDLASLLRR